MFGFSRKQSSANPTFVVGNSSLFSKKQLSPTNFGREITQVSFNFGLDVFDHYQNSPDLSSDDLRLLKEVEGNPGIMQLLFVNLITGAFLCYAKLLLKVPDEIVSEVENGVLTELRSKMPGFNEDVLEDHKKFTTSFSIAIEREVLQIEKGASISLFLSYVNHFYPEFGSGKADVPSGLFKSLTGYGSRVMSLCQDQLKITFQRG